MYQKAAFDRKDGGGGVYSLQKELVKSPLAESFNIVLPSLCLFKMKRFPEIGAGRNNVEGSVEAGVPTNPSGPGRVLTLFPAEVSHLLFFLTKVRCACAGLFCPDCD